MVRDSNTDNESFHFHNFGVRRRRTPVRARRSVSVFCFASSESADTLVIVYKERHSV